MAISWLMTSHWPTNELCLISEAMKFVGASGMQGKWLVLLLVFSLIVVCGLDLLVDNLSKPVLAVVWVVVHCCRLFVSIFNWFCSLLSVVWFAYGLPKWSFWTMFLLPLWLGEVMIASGLFIIRLLVTFLVPIDEDDRSKACISLSRRSWLSREERATLFKLLTREISSW